MHNSGAVLVPITLNLISTSARAAQHLSSHSISAIARASPSDSAYTQSMYGTASAKGVKNPFARSHLQAVRLCAGVIGLPACVGSRCTDEKRKVHRRVFRNNNSERGKSACSMERVLGSVGFSKAVWAWDLFYYCTT